VVVQPEFSPPDGGHDVLLDHRPQRGDRSFPAATLSVIEACDLFLECLLGAADDRLGFVAGLNELAAAVIFRDWADAKPTRPRPE
jgi:hypothetical protein